MKLLIIANNINGNIDGIGKHARMLAGEFSNRGHYVKVLSASSGFGIWGSIFTFGMSVVMLKAIFIVLCKRFDYVIIEYPFKEHNPLIVLIHPLLYYAAHIRQIRVAFSMHEYDRVHVLRKRVIDVFLHYSDLIFITERKYFERFPKCYNKIRLRTLLNQFECNIYTKEFNRDRFCYFGLVNPSKAFKEMLDAWNVFNANREYQLDIISASDLSDWNLSQYPNVVYHHNLCGDDVVKVMSECAFSIIPVLPDIGLNNSSFVSAIQCGCIPIGKFGETLNSKSFVIGLNSYKQDEFVTTLKNVVEIEKEKFVQMSKDCVSFGKNFSVGRTADQMLDAFVEFKKH